MMKKGSTPIRILHYIGSLEAGGSQSMVMNIYRNIDRKKIQFDFIVDRKGKNDFFHEPEIEKLGGKIYVFDEYLKGYNYLSFKRQWERFFKEHPEYKIIHCHVRSVASIVLKIAKKYGLKTICHAHSISNGKGAKAVAKKILQKGIVKNSDYLLACSKEAAIWLYGEKDATSKKCVVINNAVDPDRYRFDSKARIAIRKKYGVKNDEVLVGHVGRFVDVKNHAFMLELADALKDSKVKFIFCGDGELKNSIADAAKSMDNILFYNEYDKANKLYSALDLFILPSKYEGLGMVLIEAQFNGLPCLASLAVPREAEISDEINFLPLIEEAWKGSVVRTRPDNKHNIGLYPYSNEYIIFKSVHKIENIYTNLAGDY